MQFRLMALCVTNGTLILPHDTLFRIPLNHPLALSSLLPSLRP